MGDVTLLLASADVGEPPVVDRLFELLYAELRRIAHAKLRLCGPAVELQTTSLVHEAYLRLVDLERLNVDSRLHFLAYAARVMRSVVVDLVREQQAERRGGGLAFVTLSAVDDCLPAGAGEVQALHEALEELAAVDPQLVTVVEMRYFGGLDHAEIAHALGISVRSVERAWQKARILLYQVLRAR